MATDNDAKKQPPPLVRKMRSHTRHALEVPVTILTEAPVAHAGHVLFDTRDLSSGGAFLKSASLLEIGEEITLEFQLDGGKTVRARCKVVRVERKAPSGMGISFTKLDAGDQAALKAFMAARG
jgi:c-di-GMP-binding flagellar brake protein YcgR